VLFGCSICSPAFADRASLTPPFASDPWSDFQIIMWQPQTPAAWAALKRLGVTAGMVKSNRRAQPNAYVEGQVKALTSADMRWYLEDIATDFYSTYHEYTEGRPVNWRFQEVKRRYKENPNDPSVFIREPSLSDSKWLDRISHRLFANVRAFRRYKPLFYNLADEPGIADLSAFWDFDFSPPSLAGMREWLRRRYGSLARLDAEWGARFRSWNKVVPETTDQAMLRSDQNFAPWADFKEWMDVAFARALRTGTEAVHAADPNAVAAIEGAQIPGWGGYDYSRLPKAVDAIEVYDHGENLELVRSFNPRAVLLTTSFPKAAAIAAGRYEAHRVWRELLRGTRGLILWDPKGEFVDAKGKIGPRGREAAPYFREIRGGLGALLINSKRHFDPAAILYSPMSWRIEWLLDHGDTAWSSRGARSEYEDDPVRIAIRNYTGALEHVGLQPRFVSARELEEGELDRIPYRVLILPRTIALSDAAAARIRGFIDKGGTVLADGEPGLFDEHGKKRATPLLSGIFGRSGQRRGRAIRLAARRLDDCPVRRGLAQLLAAAGVKAPFPLTGADGEPSADVETYVFQNGRVAILALLREPVALQGCGKVAREDGRETVVVKLPRPYQIYDVRAQRALGRHARIAVPIGLVGPTILALAPNRLAAPEISGPSRAAQGDKLLFRIALPHTSAARDVVHFSVVDPSGRVVLHYSKNLILRGGEATAVLPLALNDPTGTWRLRARDVMAGAAAVAELTVALRPAAASLDISRKK
jgi:hypothetical protein